MGGESGGAGRIEEEEYSLTIERTFEDGEHKRRGGGNKEGHRQTTIEENAERGKVIVLGPFITKRRRTLRKGGGDHFTGIDTAWLTG